MLSWPVEHCTWDKTSIREKDAQQSSAMRRDIERILPYNVQLVSINTGDFAGMDFVHDFVNPRPIWTIFISKCM